MEKVNVLYVAICSNPVFGSASIELKKCLTGAEARRLASHQSSENNNCYIARIEELGVNIYFEIKAKYSKGKVVEEDLSLVDRLILIKSIVDKQLSEKS